MFNTDQQIEQARQQVAQVGFAGTAVIDVHPSDGFLRMRVKVDPADKLMEFMTNYADIVTMTLAMMNVQAKVHIDKD